MANTRELRRRIKSVKNTAQITKAMQMVAATKMRRAQLQAEAGDPYAQTLNATLKSLAEVVDPGLNPLLQENDAKSIGVILLSTDKGLVGALNTNVLRATSNFIREKQNLKFYTIGKKGRQYLVKTSKELVADFENPDQVTFRQAKQLARLAVKAFLDKEIKELYLIYPDFISTLRQEPRVEKLLPIAAESLHVESSFNSHPELGSGSTGIPKQVRNDKGGQNDQQEFIIEPNPYELLDFVLNHSVESRIYKALLETKASQFSAQMMAMQNATDNAKELVSDLTLSYNQIRQDSITRELLEITSAQAALE